MNTNQKMSAKLLLGLGISTSIISLAISLEEISSYEANAQNTADSCITQNEIFEAQKTWGDGIVAIGNAYQNSQDYQSVAADLVDRLYGYDEGKVLFKPTKASEKEFRLTETEAVSYFVKGVVPEDNGFAIQPWSQVQFKNAGVIIDCDSALSMGDYYFTDASTGEEVKAEYSFGYHKDSDGELRINLHHSSFPYEETE